MSESYIPTSDGLALTWMQTFSDGISASSAGYMVSSADAANIASVVSDYAAAYALAVDPATRTPVNVINKDNARNVAEQLCRHFAILIKYNAGISDGAKVAIGVRP